MQQVAVPKSRFILWEFAINDRFKGGDGDQWLADWLLAAHLRFPQASFGFLFLDDHWFKESGEPIQSYASCREHDSQYTMLIQQATLSMQQQNSYSRELEIFAVSTCDYRYKMMATANMTWTESFDKLWAKNTGKHRRTAAATG